MEEEQTTSASQSVPDESSENNFEWKKIGIGVGVIVIVLTIGLVSFFVGRSSDEAGSPSPTPAPLPLPSPVLLPTEAPSATDSGTISPTTTPATSPTPTPQTITKTLSSSEVMDGFQSSNGGGNKTLEIRAGRNANLVTRGLVSFDLSTIPDNATITEATLRLYQTKTVGDPYGVGGALKIDHLNYGDSLENADYASAALLSSFTTLTNNTVVEWKDAEVTTQVKDDLDNSRPRTQFRIHFVTENTGGDVTGDFAYFEAEENTEGTGNTPELIVEYY